MGGNDTPDPGKLGEDSEGLKQAHGRTGRLLKQAGLPFEEEEFGDDEERASAPAEDDQAK